MLVWRNSVLPDWLTPQVQEQLIDGLILTVGLTIVTSITSLLAGYWAAIWSDSNSRVKQRLAGIFIELFRNVPALILVIFFAFAVPNVFPIDLRRTIFFNNPVVDLLGDIIDVPIPYYAAAAALALTLNTGGHLAEVFRSGFAAVPRSRVDAARSLGASETAALRAVVAPIGIRIAFPAVSNRLIHNLKNTSLASFVAVPELFQVIQGSITRTFRATELLIFAAILYLVLSTVMTAGLALIERRLGKVQGAGEQLRV